MAQLTCLQLRWFLFVSLSVHCLAELVVNSGFLSMVYYETQHSDLMEANDRYTRQTQELCWSLALARHQSKAKLVLLSQARS